VKIHQRQSVEDWLAENLSEGNDHAEVCFDLQEIVDLIGDWKAKLERSGLYRRGRHCAATTAAAVRPADYQSNLVARLA